MAQKSNHSCHLRGSIYRIFWVFLLGNVSFLDLSVVLALLNYFRAADVRVPFEDLHWILESSSCLWINHRHPLRVKMLWMNIIPSQSAVCNRFTDILEIHENQTQFSCWVGAIVKLKINKSFRSYSVVFVRRGRRGRWWLSQWLPGASQVLGAWVVGWHLPPLPFGWQVSVYCNIKRGRRQITAAQTAQIPSSSSDADAHDCDPGESSATTGVCVCVCVSASVCVWVLTLPWAGESCC